MKAFQTLLNNRDDGEGKGGGGKMIIFKVLTGRNIIEVLFNLPFFTHYDN